LVLLGACTDTSSAPAAPTASLPVAPTPAITPRPTFTRLPIQSQPPIPPGVPTATPLPTPVSPTADQAAYLQSRSAQFGAAVKAIGVVEQQLAQATRNPALLQDQAWQTTTTQDAAALKAAGQQLAQQQAISADLADLDRAFTAAGPELVTDADQVTQAVAANDAAAVARAATSLATSDVTLQHLTQSLNEAKRKYGLASPTG
jgi:hypothetical protein